MFQVAIKLDKGRFLNPTVFNDRESAEELKRKTQVALGEEIPIVIIEMTENGEEKEVKKRYERIKILVACDRAKTCRRYEMDCSEVYP